jgi:hypothetical protein
MLAAGRGVVVKHGQGPCDGVRGEGSGAVDALTQSGDAQPPIQVGLVTGRGVHIGDEKAH